VTSKHRTFSLDSAEGDSFVSANISPWHFSSKTRK